MGVHLDTGHLFFTVDFWKSSPPQLYNFLFIPQAWSLGLELTYYVVAPFIVRRSTKSVVLIILLSLGLRLFIYDYLKLHNDPWTYRFFPTELLFFLLGYLSYKIYVKIKSMHFSISSFLFFYFSLITLIFIFYILPSGEIPNSPFTIKEILYFVFFTISIPFLFKFLKGSKLDSQIGELSYPMYISHLLVSLIYTKFTNHSMWMVTVLTILLSLLLNRFIAVPTEKYRQARIKK